METIVHQALVADILTAIGAAGLSKAEFGRLAANDPRLVYDLEKGRELRFSTREKVEAALDEIRAKGAA